MRIGLAGIRAKSKRLLHSDLYGKRPKTPAPTALQARSPKVVICEACVEGRLEAPKHLAGTVHDLRSSLRAAHPVAPVSRQSRTRSEMALNRREQTLHRSRPTAGSSIQIVSIATSFLVPVRVWRARLS